MAMGYNARVSAKEALLEMVREMSEEDARDAYRILADVFETPAERPAISREEKDAALKAFARLDAGRGIAWDELNKSLGFHR
jgi:hypothetical protein